MIIPMLHRGFLALLAALASCICIGSAGSQEADRPEQANFANFLQELWPDASAKGVSREVFDAAFVGLAPDPRVIAATRKQPEYGKPVGAYVNGIASPARIETGAG